MSTIANFAQSFPLNRSRLKLVLEAVARKSDATWDEIAMFGGFNKPVAEGFVGWGRHAGLIRAKGKGNELTEFGRLVQEYDPFLIDPNTLWVIHYWLCTQHEERSEAWYLFANQYAVPGLETSAEQFRIYYEQATASKDISKSAFSKDSGLLINCYTSSEALGSLSIMRSAGAKNHYEIWKPTPPHIHVRAFGLFDYWKRHSSESNTISLDQVATSAGSIGKVFMLTLDEVRATINGLASMGLVTYSDTQHRPVNRLFEGTPEDLLRKYYESI